MYARYICEHYHGVQISSHHAKFQKLINQNWSIVWKQVHRYLHPSKISGKNNKADEIFLEGYRERSNGLWKLPLWKQAEESPRKNPKSALDIMPCNNAYGLPNVEAVVKYLHATAGFHLKSTWLKAIKVGNYITWPGMDYYGVNKYFPRADETIKKHISQTLQGVWSTIPKPMATPKAPEADINLAPNRYHEIHVWVKHSSKKLHQSNREIPSPSSKWQPVHNGDVTFWLQQCPGPIFQKSNRWRHCWCIQCVNDRNQ